ncbi:hypothetical protein [Paenibacillus pasadenensis]|nr:hypothetical protein [Paenibacillus pasadenensis]
MKLDIMITVTPMLRYTRYSAVCWYRGEEHVFTSTESMRKLLFGLKSTLQRIWMLDLYGHRILGDFEESDLTTDDRLAWETPLADLRV